MKWKSMEKFPFHSPKTQKQQPPAPTERTVPIGVDRLKGDFFFSFAGANG
jgi:hypothetical protein